MQHEQTVARDFIHHFLLLNVLKLFQSRYLQTIHCPIIKRRAFIAKNMMTS